MASYISKWKASEIDELLGKSIDKTAVEKVDGGLNLRIVLTDGSSVSLPLALGFGLSVDNVGEIVVNDTFQFGGIVSGVTVETSSTTATSGMIVFDTELNVFLLRSGLKYYMGWNTTSSYLANSAEWENRKTTPGCKFYIDNEDETLTWYVSNGSTLLMSGGGLSQEAKDYTDKKVSAVANAQLKLSVKDNGNVVLSNANGESKEFMPATPSGDPMHYAYVVAGSEYNDTGEDITRIGVFGDAITWKAGYWWLNELGDISNEEMKYIYLYRYTAPSSSQVKSYFSAFRKTRTPMIDVPARAAAIDASNFSYSTSFETIALSQTQELVYLGNMTAFMLWSQKVKKIVNGLDLTYLKTENAINKAFDNATSLEEVRLYKLQVSVEFKQSKNLSNASILYMIENEIAEKTITITLHANAYARAMADASIVEALAAHTNVTLASA